MNFVDMLFEAITGGKKVLKGKVSPELNRQIREVKADQKYLEEMVEAELKREAERIQERVKDKYSLQIHVMEQRSKELWGRIYAEVGIDKDDDDNYSVDREGNVYQVVTPDFIKEMEDGGRPH